MSAKAKAVGPGQTLGTVGPGQTLPGADEPADGRRLVQLALAFRAKYRVNDRGEKLRVMPHLIGFHWANRGGQSVNGQRCQTLLRTILKDGFDPEEANNCGILVQEKPMADTIHQWNVRACDGQELLSPLVKGQQLTFGSLSHSHLNQILKNLLCGLKLGLKDPRFEDHQGCFSLDLLAEHDAEFVDHARLGLHWEVLAHAINDDPEALRTIQAACNVKNAVAMPAHEMEAINAISALCVSSASVEARLSFEYVQEKLGVELRAFADDPDFKHLFSFVINLGGGKGPFIRDLAMYTGKWCDPEAKTVLCCSLFFCAVLYCITVYNVHLRHHLVQYSTVQCSTYCTALFNVVQHCNYKVLRCK
jgi:hypothetical protein